MLLTLASCARMPVPVTLPSELAAVLSPTCKQVLRVTAADDRATTGELRMLQRTAANDWQAFKAAIPVRLGRHGMAWGHGAYAMTAAAGFRIKQEGDGCAPVGVFRITQAFGKESRPQWLKLPYLQCTAHHFGIDDVRSRHYNQIIDDREVTCDWTSPETMIPSSGCYNLGAAIDHNPRHQPGLGSCIFLHIWQGEHIPTSGCTAMSAQHLRTILAWLDPISDPHLVQFVQQH